MVSKSMRAFCEAGQMQEVVVNGGRNFSARARPTLPHFYPEDNATLTYAPAEAPKIAGLPNAAEGTTIVRVDVVIRFRRA